MSEKYLKSEFIRETIKIGRRGQITIPKTVRMIESLKRGDKLKLVRQPTGTIYLEKLPKEKDPVERILEITNKYPKFDFDKAWKEVQEERRRSER
jgi:AbrB family looped-hinge helix DNA binding protein